MLELYPLIKLTHIVAALSSGSLFALRGLLLNFGQTWVMARPVRVLTYTIDTVLLTAAVLLTIIIHQYPLRDSWLTMKIVLLVVYVLLGFFAFWQARSKAARLAAWLAALLVFGFIVSVAVAHDPRGIFAGT